MSGNLSNRSGGNRPAWAARAITLAAISLEGCYAAAYSSDACHHTDKVVEALVGGIADPVAVPLTPNEQAAIVAVLPVLGTGSSYCSGTLIAVNWVLTARHCDVQSQMVVRIGRDVWQPDVTVPVLEVIRHDELDVALLRVPSLSAVDIQPIALLEASLDERWQGAHVQLAGLGYNSETRVTARRLFLVATIEDLDEAHVVVDGHGLGGACLGDSGAPMLVWGTDARPRVAAVLSEGSATCRDVDYYTRADTMREWAIAVTGARADSDECTHLNGTGLCQAGRALWCHHGQAHSMDCANTLGCGWSRAAAGYRCLTELDSECETLDAFGECNAAGIAQWCERGRLQQAACGSTAPCQRNPGTGRVGCGSPSERCRTSAVSAYE